jgi:uncharacterized protein YbjT (DUF2867 family)
MELAVFGATGRTGQALVARALAHGWRVRAFVRTQAGARLPLPNGLAIVHGDPERQQDVAATVRGVDGVCCVFGPRAGHEAFCAPFTRAIVEAMRSEGRRRLVCVTGAMIGALPPNTSPGMRIAAALMRRRQPAAVLDRAQQESVVMTSGLDWTLVKPPRLTDGPLTKNVHADPALPIGMFHAISRQDLADFVFRAAAHDRFVGVRVYVRG